MCDIIVRDPSFMWDKGSPCERKPKHHIEVETVTYRSDVDSEKFWINVCGQHRSMLERGRRLEAVHIGKRFDVHAELSELGEAEEKASRAQSEYESMQRAVTHRRTSIGEAADFVLEYLIKATDGDNQLRDFVGTLIRYQEAKAAKKEAYQKFDEADTEVRRLKALTKDS